MDTDALYELANQFLPPLVVALVALAATLSTLRVAWRRRHPRAAAIAAGTLNVSLIYFWTHLAGLSAAERAIGIRVALVTLLLSILFYNESARPFLLGFVRRALARRGRMWWKK